MRKITTFGELKKELYKTLMRAAAMDKDEASACVASFAMECEFWAKSRLASMARETTAAMERVRKEKG